MFEEMVPNVRRVLGGSNPTTLLGEEALRDARATLRDHEMLKKEDERALKEKQLKRDSQLDTLNECRKQRLAQDPDNLELRRTHGTMSSYLRYLRELYPEHSKFEIPPEAELSRFD